MAFEIRAVAIAHRAVVLSIPVGGAGCAENGVTTVKFCCCIVAPRN